MPIGEHRFANRWLSAFAGASFLALAAAATPAVAQEDDAGQRAPANGASAAQQREGAANQGALDDIVVTATRSATYLQDTPLAITAVTGKALEDHAFTRIQDVAQIVPNASFNQGAAAWGRTLQAFIRGVGQYDFNLALEPGVAFYIDDQYYPLTAGSVFDLLDLERVEVLRGPQGTVFGRNAIGGAVNLISKPPSATPEAYVEVTYGSYNRQDIKAGFNYPLTDNLYLRVSGLSKSRHGYQKLLDFRCQMVKEGTPELAGNFPSLNPSNGFLSGDAQDNCVLGRYGGEDVHALRGALRYAGSGIDLTFSADYTDDESAPAADKLVRLVPNATTRSLDALIYQPLWGVSYDQRFLTGSPFSTYATYADPIPAGTVIPGTYYDGSAIRGGINLERKAGLRSYGFSGKAVADLADNLVLTVLGGYRNLTTTIINDPDGSPLGLQTVGSEIGFHSYTLEPRINYSSDLFDVTAGVFYYDSAGLYTNSSSTPLLNFQQNQRVNVDSTSKAAYAQAVIRPLDRLSLTLGGRYSDDRKDVLFNDGVSIVQRSRSGKRRWDYRVGADYRITPDITVYGSVASGYRPAAVNTRPFQASQLGPIGEEALTAYELGFKGDLFDRRLRLNVAAFYSDYSNRAVSQTGSECLNNGTKSVCDVPGPQVDPAVTGGQGLCRDYNPAADGPVDLSRGIGVTCISSTNYINTPGKIKGLEAEIEARPIDGLLINGSIGYTHFNAPELRNDPLVVDTTPVYVPEWTASGGIAYDIPVSSLKGKITPRIDAYYQSTVSFNARSDFAQVPGRTLFNGRITYVNDSSDWTVAVGATNLFNKRYYLNLFDLVPFGQPTTEGQPGRPREFYLTVRRNF